ncbi:PREDICTED: cubilin-like [Papilio xuthus]|uniref:Cubilin-like n=1 Tax=Papilio xuthus TaxID=66420 RepID=A0AAJ7ECI3_PAPXU|nr:PREDICTED: cubilin-like [Papilio xuthus]
MHLSSVHSAEEERFIVSGIRQSSDYSAGAVYWLGVKVQRPGQNFSWVDGSIFEYQAWPPYNDTEDMEEACLGVQWRTSPVPSQPSGLYWSQHKCAVTGGYICKRRLNPEHILKNNTVEGNSGELSSPNYPGLYDNDVDYWVHVSGPPDTRLVFVFNSIDLEYQNDCLYDFVELKDGLSSKSSRYCGSLGETRWVATSNQATLHFHSDYNTQGSGFSLSWRAVELAGCPFQTFTSKEGQLRSPNYPQFLLPGLDCTIDILAPSGKRIFLNISHFDFGYGTFANGVPINVSEAIPEDTFLEVQIDPDSTPIRPFVDSKILTNGLFVSQSEIMRLRLRTGENVTGAGFLALFKTVSYLNLSHVLELSDRSSGRLSAPNWPGSPPLRAKISTRILAPHGHTLSVAFAKTRLVAPPSKTWPCGEGKGWIEVKDSYTDNNGTEWTLCEVGRGSRMAESSAPLVINSYLHSLAVTQHAGDRGVSIDVLLLVRKDPEYHNKLLLIPEETNLESCYPNPCLNGGLCASDDTKNFCQCAGYYTGRLNMTHRMSSIRTCCVKIIFRQVFSVC